MKPGFGNKKNKNKNRKKKARKQNKDGSALQSDDMDMQDAHVGSEGLQDGIDYTYHGDEDEQPLTAKEKQQQKMQLKKALKVKVASLKQSRNKLTKLAANKPVRKELSSQIKQLMKEQSEQGNKAAAAGQPAAAGAASAMVD